VLRTALLQASGKIMSKQQQQQQQAATAAAAATATATAAVVAKAITTAEVSGSNIYSIGECTLLKWLQLHSETVAQRLLQVQQAELKATSNNSNSSSSHQQQQQVAAAARITSFAHGLQQSTVLGDLIRSHCPHLAKVLTLRETGSNSSSSSNSHDNANNNTGIASTAATAIGSGSGAVARHASLTNSSSSDEFTTIATDNCERVVSALTALKCSGGFTAKDIVTSRAGGRDMVLLALHLFQALPQLVPKTVIEFKCALGDSARKSIELKNPSSKPIEYEVTVQGSGATDFRVPNTR
jgi:hypothetical protein